MCACVCVCTCVRAAHNASFHSKQKWFQSDEGAVNGRLLIAKKAHIWTLPQLSPSGIYVYTIRCIYGIWGRDISRYSGIYGV